MSYDHVQIISFLLLIHFFLSFSVNTIFPVKLSTSISQLLLENNSKYVASINDGYVNVSGIQHFKEFTVVPLPGTLTMSSCGIP